MMSRSASRTRWMMFCFAACAAMRPNFSGGSFASSWSPISASGSSSRRAASSVTWLSASSIVSTTVLISKSSTSPTSGLNLASMFFSSPKVFLAADSIASSSACTMMSRLMPFSLHTCSMTRFRSGNIGPSCPSGVRRPGRASEVVFDVGLLDGRERQLDAADRLVLDGDAVGRHGLERTVEHAPVADRVVRPHANALPERPTEMGLAQQRPVHAGRRALELVATRNGIVRVEHVAELAGDPRELVDRDATVGPVDQQPQDEASALRAILHVDELEPRPQGEGLRELPDAVRHRGRVHVMQSSKIKKWARGPLRLIRATQYFRLSPMTTAWLTCGCIFSRFSIFCGATYFPPDVLIRSFFRSVIRRNPSASTSPMSPVWNQACGSQASAVASGRR